MRNSLGLLGLALVVVLFIAFNAFFVVDQREQAMIVQLGNPVGVIKEPGLAMKVPFLQSVIFFNRAIRGENTGSKSRCWAIDGATETRLK